MLDQTHLLAAARHIERNPVRAGLAARSEDWPFSSVRPHFRRRSYGLVRTEPLLDLVPDWQAFLAALEQSLGRRLRRRKPGPRGHGEAAGARPAWVRRGQPAARVSLLLGRG